MQAICSAPVEPQETHLVISFIALEIAPGSLIETLPITAESWIEILGGGPIDCEQ